MDRKDAERVIKVLGTEWPVDHQPIEWTTYRRYTKALTNLIASTSHIGISASIFALIINQANQLNKSSEWIEQEILFEAGIKEIGNRSVWSHQAMENEGLIGEEFQGLYNERITRFSFHD